GKEWNNTTGPVSPGVTDLRSVALHEFTHSLGFLSLINSDGSGADGAAVGSPDVYSHLDNNLFVGSGSGAIKIVRADKSFNTAQLTTTGEAGKTDFTAALSTGDVYFHGEFAKAANGGNAIRMNNDDLSHLHSSLSSTAVMSPFIGDGVEKRTFLNFEVGMLIDMGYNQYFWKSGTNGNWGNNTSSTAASPWQNINTVNTLSPVGTITQNVVLTFQGSGATSYTSTNNLDVSGNGNAFFVNRVNLTSTSTGTVTIAAGGAQKLQFGTSIGVTPEIRQQGTGAVDISHAIEITDTGLPTDLVLGGNGSATVTISGPIRQKTGDVASVTKSGDSVFVLTGTNTYTGGTTVTGGVLGLDGTLASGVTVSGGIFSGSGTVTGDITIQSAGAIGADLAGATNQTQLNANATRLTATGLLTLNNGATITLFNDQSLQFGQSYTLVVANAGSYGVDPSTYLLRSGSGTFANFTGLSLVFASSELTLQFTPVPEPTTVFALSAGALGLLRLARRRRSTVAVAA
ncbi:MAG: autotransporter-associated beta strand repeat-containing protein, partial [Fimbriiglobus sp.]